MIFKMLSWLRFILVLFLLYLFAYQYLFKKYASIMVHFDHFNYKNRFAHQFNFTQALNLTQKQITGKYFTSDKQNINQKVHIGELIDFQNTKLQQFYQQQSSTLPNTLNNLLSKTLLPTKKVDSYQFNFYNWYKFQLTFTDIGHDSYFQFRLSQKNKGSHQIVQKIAFKLPQNFYFLNQNHQNNKLKINYNAKGIELNVQQFLTNEHYFDMQSDGNQNEPFFHLTQNKTQLTEEEYKKFGSKKTITKFNFTLTRKDYEIKAHISHVIRHNQCLTSYQSGLLRHKCMGGYGKGKILFSQFIRESINTKNSQYYGNWQRNSYNLDNSRVRTVFVGERYLENNHLQRYIPMIDYTDNLKVSLGLVDRSKKWIELDFFGFNKPEYYSKKDKIQKQRWVGMSLYKPLTQGGHIQPQTLHENYFFINGNIHPIYQINFTLPLLQQGLRNGQIIRFTNKAEENSIQQLTPSFEIGFQIQNSTLVEESGVLNSKRIYRVDGYWRGWIDEGSLFQDDTVREHYNSTYEYGYVEFYEIEGTIKITQENI